MLKAAAALTLAVSSLGTAAQVNAVEQTSRVEELVASMPLEKKITQMLMVDFRQWQTADAEKATDMTVMNDEVYKIVQDYDFGSLIYFANNIKTTEETYALTQAFQEAATSDGGIALLITTDQEGGSVYRLGSGTALPGNMALGATGSLEDAKKAGEIIGSELSVLGINGTLAPVVDVNNNPNNPVIGLRSFSDDPTLVGNMASALIQGLNEYNVIGCAKHFPGHGDTATDSHYGLPVVSKSKDELLENELKPYTVAIEQGIDMIMTAHILYPGLDDSTIYSEKTQQQESVPATMSKAIITDLLKGEMGFDGVVSTDAMNMSAIANTWDEGQAVVNAIAAGIDLICMPTTLRTVDDLTKIDGIIADVEAAVADGTISMERIDDAVTRILTLKEEKGILDYNASDYSLETALATVGSDANRETEREIAADAVTLIKNENDVLPLQLNETSKVLIMLPYSNEPTLAVLGWNRGIAAGTVPEGATMEYVLYTSKKTPTDEMKEKIAAADYVLIVTEVSSASKMASGTWASAFAENAVTYAKEVGTKSAVISADKPYDVQLYADADAIMAVYGCKGSSVDPTEAIVGGMTGTSSAYGPNIIAGVEVALGTFDAKGTLPVNIYRFDTETRTYTDEIVYPRGYGLSYPATEEPEPETPVEPEEPEEPGEEVKSVVMYRLYNPNSGEHFYTGSEEERDNLISLGWRDEEIAWIAPETSDTPVFRLYNPNAGDHHYTTSEEERDFLVKEGWNDEGIGWYSAFEDGVPVYRAYNPNAVAGAHHFTTSKDEINDIVKAGWRDEDLAWYALAEK
jgi:beta-N-acetylhexosaminidase